MRTLSPRTRPGRSALLALGLVCLLGGLAGCQRPTPAPTTPTVPATAAVPTASPTPAPAAAVIDGVDLTQADFAAELGRFAAAAGHEPNPAERQTVLDDLIARELLAQGAAQAGYQADVAALEARQQKLAAAMGGADALTAWLTAQGYTPESFQHSLERELAAAWMRDKLLSEIPQAAEQVHALQILLYNEADAQAVLAQLQAGAKFADLAGTYDLILGGELGWFPRGFLYEPALEQAAFALEAGQYSPIVHTPLGYHLVQVTERQPDRPLDPQMRARLGEAALQAWVQARRAAAKIEILAP